MSSQFTRELHFCQVRKTSYTMDGFYLLYLLLICLMRSGDVETNPGPNTAESTVSEMEFLKLAQDIDPSHYYNVGISLGLSHAQLKANLIENSKNFKNSFMDIFMKWNVKQQPPHSNRRQLLADKLREIDLGGLSDGLVNEPPISNSTGEYRGTVPQGMRPIPPGPVNHHQHPSHPAPRYESVAYPPQQLYIQPTRIPRQTSYEITEIKLRGVSNKLGVEWRMVGTYLDFNNSQIEVMHAKYPVVKECIFQMLLEWRNTNGVEATKEKFKRVLRRSNREDLVDFIDEADD